MKNDRSAHVPVNPQERLPANSWVRFWFSAIPTTGLSVLRVGAGLLFLFWLLSFLGYEAEFFSLSGFLDSKGIIEMQRQPEISPAPIGWSILYLAGESRPAFEALYWGSLAVLALFTLGVATRITGVLTWVVVVSFLSNPLTSYEGDYLLGILAFYLMIGYLLLGQWNGNLSPAARILGSYDDFVLARWIFPAPAHERPTSYAANFTMRLLQIHLAIILVVSGLHKLQMSDWWAGVALWYPLHPPLQTTMEGLRREIPYGEATLFLVSLVTYLVIAWELAFPLFAWRKGWGRVLLLGGATLYWPGVFFVFKLPLFGPFVFLGCLSFLRPEEWESLRRQARSWLGSSTGTLAAAPKRVAVTAIEEIK